MIAATFEVGVKTKKVSSAYDNIIANGKTELEFLLKTSVQDIEQIAGSQIAEAIKKVRAGYVIIEPGYDGEFGKVGIDVSGAVEQTSLLGV